MLHKKKSYHFFSRISNKSQSTKGRDLLIFLLFLGVASIFWLVSNLNNEIEEDIEIPIEIIEIPDSITILDELPTNINVTLREKGTSLVRYIFGNNAPLKVSFSNYAQGEKYTERLIIKHNDIELLLKKYFGNGIQIASIQPDSIKVSYTSSFKEKRKLKINADISSHFQYIINGEISANIDSVDVYKISDIDTIIYVVNTQPIKRTELKDTTIITVHIKPIKGYKIVPDNVTITIPVEPLIAKEQSILIKTANVPDSVDLILFPQVAEITYLLPMSKYNISNEIEIIADYNSTKSSNSLKIPLSISNIPIDYRNIDLLTDSVEYIIEQK